MAWFEALVSIVISLVPILIVFLILMDGYRTKLNSEKIIAQNEEIIALLKQNNKGGGQTL
ncbi:hypothetical protein BHU61_00630 [Macrococcus epidermidis]|uniref:Uncharacterized protein n=2 Tax=Staphylococcaceae TaxID=90964 RepID=A0A395G9B2_9STAP|nr:MULTISPECIES: hypothetical protein [Macrococcus]MCG7419592.1 hypothetical protein [Macrococcus epidermidis]RAI80605.1 hypothetical protein BFS35_009200 [Macrococcus goetzii]RAK45984.1 hypothetical protein BHU61_00630 [Macrococcus epidermidis]UTH16781.1 hypothetical protein KFV12_03135 [Macrococcus epidermidis]